MVFSECGSKRSVCVSLLCMVSDSQPLVVFLIQYLNKLNELFHTIHNGFQIGGRELQGQSVLASKFQHRFVVSSYILVLFVTHHL